MENFEFFVHKSPKRLWQLSQKLLSDGKTLMELRKEIVFRGKGWKTFNFFDTKPKTLMAIITKITF